MNKEKKILQAYYQKKIEQENLPAFEDFKRHLPREKTGEAKITCREVSAFYTILTGFAALFIAASFTLPSPLTEKINSFCRANNVRPAMKEKITAIDNYLIKIKNFRQGGK